MTGKTGIIAITAMGLLLAGAVQAGGVHYEYARVVSVEPEYQTHRNPVDREVCWEERGHVRESRHHDSFTPTVIGAIIGGVVGNQFGGGSGRKFATAGGALLGGSIAHDVSRQSRHHSGAYYPVTRERCTLQRDYREQTVISGYRVGYEYDGQIYYTYMANHPGDTIRVRVSVNPY